MLLSAEAVGDIEVVRDIAAEEPERAVGNRAADKMAADNSDNSFAAGSMLAD